MAPRDLSIRRAGSRRLEWGDVKAYNPRSYQLSAQLYVLSSPAGEVPMIRQVLAPAAALILSVLVPTVAFAQGAQAAAPTTPAPTTQARFVKPIKGIAHIEVIQAPSKRVGNEVVTVVKVKNVSNGAIHLLKLDEYWYDKSRKNIVTGTT